MLRKYMLLLRTLISFQQTLQEMLVGSPDNCFTKDKPSAEEQLGNQKNCHSNR